MSGALSSLVVGERTVSRCDDGLLLAEYALFDPSEVMVSGSTGQGVREQGYFTTAASGRERLHALGVTPELVSEAFRALRPRLMRALARSPAVLFAIDRLGAYEAFEGAVYDANRGTYQGAWLDLEALVLACPLRNAGAMLQSIHLRQVLDEVPDDAPVRLLTLNATGGLRPGERTWQKISLDALNRLPAVLRAMRVPKRKNDPDEGGEVREELLRNLRARSAGTKVAEPRIRSLATLVARTGKTPPPAPLAEGQAPVPVVYPSPRPPPFDLSRHEGSLADLDPLALFEELRGHTQLLRGEDHLRAVAQYLSSMASRSPAQPELGVLASRAWLAAGEPGHARHFSRLVTENSAASDAVRLLALEIMDSTANQESMPPPSVDAATDSGRIKPMPILLLAPPPRDLDENVPTERQGSVPASQLEGASLPPLEHMPFSKAPSVELIAPSPPPPPPSSGPPTDREIDGPTEIASAAVAVVAQPVVVVEGPRRMTTTLRIRQSDRPAPPRVIDAPIEPPPRTRPSLPAPARPPSAPPPQDAQAWLEAPAPPPVVRSEIVESLALPPGLSEEMLPAGARPTNPAQARIAMTRLSRTLGRDYRLWYGSTLMTNAVAIEAMQRHLRRRFSDPSAAAREPEKVEQELMRHGALLSEILARALGGRWVELPPDRPGHWAMVLHPDLRVWPIGRVYRFFQQGHREADLVAFYLDLEAQVRRAG